MGLTPITPQSVDRITALVIGPAGIGKTSLLRTIPADDKVCVLSAEGGLLCVRDLVKAGRVEGFEINNLTDFQDAFRLCQNDSEMRTRYRWLFIDSLTEISGRCEEQMKAKHPAKEDSFKMWGSYNDSMTALIKGFRDLRDYNVVFTCLETVDKDQDNVRYYGTAVAGRQLKDRLISYFDEVLYLTKLNAEDGTEYRAFVTGPWQRYPGKDRSGALQLFEKPDLAYIKQKIAANTHVPF